jgi:manganese/zinc/iron transport system permease protein
MDNFISNISDENWILLTAILVSLACSGVGVFLVLRKLSMLGDAISHSVLFGLVVGFLLFESRSITIMLISAILVGLLTTYITSLLNKKGSLSEDASMGVTFTWLFAMGVILVSAYASKVDFDQDCILYGEIAFIPFDRLEISKTDLGPRSFWLMLFVCVSVYAYIFVGFKRLALMCFDSTLAKTLGLSLTFWHYSLMTAVSVVTVTAFESVGAILVVALLATPANTAYLLAKSLKGMLILSALFSILSSISGFYLASKVDSSISASIAICSGVIFILALLYTKAKEQRGLSIVNYNQ